MSEQKKKKEREKREKKHNNPKLTLFAFFKHEGGKSKPILFFSLSLLRRQSLDPARNLGRERDEGRRRRRREGRIARARVGSREGNIRPCVCLGRCERHASRSGVRVGRETLIVRRTRKCVCENSILKGHALNRGRLKERKRFEEGRLRFEVHKNEKDARAETSS